MDSINVVASPLPFSNVQVRRLAQPGSSVADIVLEAVPERYIGNVAIVVMIEGALIYQEYWHCVKPKPGALINIRVVPQGGGGKKNPLVTILSIAVMVVAPYLGGVMAAGMGFAAGTTAFAVASGIGTALVSAVGALAINALAPPPQQKAAGMAGNTAENPMLFIEGARNAINPFGFVPVPLGTNRIFPLQAARPYTEKENNKQYVRQLFTYGFAPKVVVSNRKIADTPLSNFSKWEQENFHTGNLHEGGKLWSNSVLQEDFSLLLTESGGWSQRSVPTNADEVILDILFNRGLTSFTKEGKRATRTVQLEVQYRKIGDMEWQGSLEFVSRPGVLMDVMPPSPPYKNFHGLYIYFMLNTWTGDITRIAGNYPMNDLSELPPTPPGYLKLAQYVQRRSFSSAAGVWVNSWAFQDTRASYIGTLLRDQESFKPTLANGTITFAEGGYASDPFTVSEATAEPVMRSMRIRFPEAGDYEVRIKRITPDINSDRIIDDVFLSAVKAVRYGAPVRAQGLSGTALRIQASDQLNGMLEEYNEVVSVVIPDYDAATNSWSDNVTSNPASLYRYYLQGPHLANPVPDRLLDIPALEEWHTYCEVRGYTCDFVTEDGMSVQDVIRMIASAGAASYSIIDGKYTVIVDRADKEFVQAVNPHNSWGYHGEMIYPKLPHAFRVTFRNAEKGYSQDEVIVYADGFTKYNANLFEELQLPHCTTAALAYKHARRYLATLIHRPEKHSFYMDVENIVFVRGDRIPFTHDVPLAGVGSGLVKRVTNNDQGKIASIELDGEIIFPHTGTFYVRIRYLDGTQIYVPVQAEEGETHELIFVNPLVAADAPDIGSLCSISTAGGELDLVVTAIEPSSDLKAKITCQNFAPEIFASETGVIPPFESNITVPLEFIRPKPPVLIEAQSDESVMQRNIDGSFISLCVLSLNNQNSGRISVNVQVRLSGTTQFSPARLISATPEKVVLTGLEEGNRYDIHIRYEREGGSVYSLPLQINNYLFIGASGLPADIQNFEIDVTGQIGLFSWDRNTDIDFSHYEIRFTSAVVDASWDMSHVLENDLTVNRISLVAQSGTYLIKAVDLGGRYSAHATTIVTSGLDGVINALATINEAPGFDGIHDNTIVYQGGLALKDVTLGEGYYYFQGVDLTESYTSYLSAALVAGGDYKNDILAMEDILAVDDILSAGDNDILAMDDILEIDDILGIGLSGWSVELQASFTDDDPENPEAEWSEWKPFRVGGHSFRSDRYRVHLQSFVPDVTPIVRELSVTVDMPDRQERGRNLIVPPDGFEMDFSPPFKEVALSILVQDGLVGDEIKFFRKDATGFGFKIWNKVSENYVERSFDFIGSGYGRVLI